MSTSKLTKAQLLARITEVEAQCAALERERDALLVAQRPSRLVQHAPAPRPDIWTDAAGRTFRRVVEKFGQRIVTRNVRVAS